MIYVAFFTSGFAALLYQVVWQRSLYAIYGINVESVTVDVTAFMLGLGLGSLAGGAVSKRPGLQALTLFGFFELGIGAFGFGSLPLFHRVGAVTLGLPAPLTALVTFLLVLFPTFLMGATLPLLVADQVQRSHNVGRAVGTLYFVNTLGSALASFAAGLALMGLLGQARTVAVAACLNLAASAGAFASHRLRGRAA
jgi:spermidine synthase